MVEALPSGVNALGTLQTVYVVIENDVVACKRQSGEVELN
jgi:hypothetical protein